MNNYLNKEISLISNFVCLEGNTTFQNVADVIKNGDYKLLPNCSPSRSLKKLIEEIRSTEEKDVRDVLKSGLLSFTNYGTFKGGRKAENLETYSGIVQIDLDNLSENQIRIAKEYARSDQSVLLGFLSPSGRGYKMLIATDAKNSDLNDKVFSYVLEKVNTNLELPIDTSTKDLARLCFFSYDPDIVINNSCIPLSIPEFDKEERSMQDLTAELLEPTMPLNAATMLSKAESLFIDTERNYHNKEGNRNNFVTSFAGKCNANGIAEHVCIEVAKNNTTLSDQEIEKTVKGIYFRHKDQHASSVKPSLVLSSTEFPSSIYDDLPNLLKNLLIDQKGAERDMILLSCLTSLSSCFPTVYFENRDGKKYYLNLTTLVIGLSANNKSKTTIARDLIRPVHEALYSDSFQFTVKNKELSKGKKTIFLIPGNSSYASIIDILKNNNGLGVIFETEADVVGDNFSKEWGDYSTLIRNAAEHEEVSKARKTDDYYIRIPNPKLSIFLTGTMGQLRKIVPNSENGLYSRFLYYVNTKRNKFENPYRISEEQSKTLYKRAIDTSSSLFELVKEHNTQPLKLLLTGYQIELIEDFYFEKEKILSLENSDGKYSYSRRSLTNWIRIAGLLTILRGNCKNLSETTINEIDFKVAHEIIKVCLANADAVLNHLEVKRRSDKSVEEQILEKLPNEFSRSEYKEAGSFTGLSDRTLDEQLKLLINRNLLIKPNHGKYQKVVM